MTNSWVTEVRSGPGPFSPIWSHYTDEAPWWEINSDKQLDIFVGDMEPVATYLPGTYVGVSRIAIPADEEEEPEPLVPTDLGFDMVMGDDQLANENPRGVTVTHLPTGIGVTYAEERTYLENSNRALNMLARLVTSEVDSSAE